MRIRNYLTYNNVQLGATYRVGKASTERYSEGFAAAAKFVNANEDEIGELLLCHHPLCLIVPDFVKVQYILQPISENTFAEQKLVISL